MTQIRKRLALAGWLVGALLGCALISPAHADYRYQYVGNPFTVKNWSAIAYVDPDTGILNYEFLDYDTESIVTAVLYTHIPLTVGSGLGDVFRFTLTRHDGATEEMLELPYPYAGPVDPAAEPGTPSNPLNNGVFSIGGVDADGLPTSWNMAINFSVRYPTGRELSMNIATSTASDSVSGGYEGFYSYSGASVGNSGRWVVSTVPELTTAALLIAGLLLIGGTSRKKQNEN